VERNAGGHPLRADPVVVPVDHAQHRARILVDVHGLLVTRVGDVGGHCGLRHRPDPIHAERHAHPEVAADADVLGDCDGRIERQALGRG
jgi:hypothetical protein